MATDNLRLNQAAAQIHGVRQQVLATQQYIRAVLAGSACNPVRTELEAIDNLLNGIFDDVEQVADLIAEPPSIPAND